MSEFEQVAKESGFLFRDDRGFYVKHSNGSWISVNKALDKFWQAAKQSMQGEPVAWLLRLKLGERVERFVRFHPNEGGQPLYTHAPDSAKTIAELQAQVEALKVKAARWEKCKTMSKQWWLNAMEESGLKGGRSLDEQIDAAIIKGGE